MRTRSQPQQQQFQCEKQTQCKAKSQQPRRHNASWSINETLRLQREYELLELNTKEISLLHARTEASIINRLVSENMIGHRTEARRE